MAGSLIRIPFGPLRAALVTLWAPFEAIQFCCEAIWDGQGKRLLEAECWANMIDFYLAAIDGEFV